MDINSVYNPENNKVTLDITMGLLSNYYRHFVGYLKNDDKAPHDLVINKKGECTAELTFTATRDLIKDSERLDGERVKVTLDLTNLNDIINSFINKAIGYKKRHTEFLPLTGYPEDDLKKDVITAVENKRNFCIIRSYEEFLEKEKQNPGDPKNLKYHQYYVDYGTSEYADIAILIYNNKLDKVKDLIEPKLKLTEWI